MAVRDLFSSKKKFIPRSQMRENFRTDPTMKKIINDPRFKHLEDPQDQRRFHQLLREKARDGKVDVKDMSEITQRLGQGRVSGISREQGRSIAKAFFPNGLREDKKIEPKLMKQEKNQKTDPDPRAGEKKKSNIGKKYTPGSSLDYGFVKTGFISEDGTKKTGLSTDNTSPDVKNKFVYLTKNTRQKILDSNKGKKASADSKSSFSSSMAATIRNRKNN